MMPYSSDSTTLAGIRTACIFGLAQGLEHSRPQVVLDERGYVPRAEDNLLPGQTLDQFVADLETGGGKELFGKFRAVHSSATLAVNCFAPLRAKGIAVDIGAHRSLAVDGFERRFATGLVRAMPPHLDVVLRCFEGLVAVESKCLEYLSPTQPALLWIRRWRPHAVLS